MSPLLFLVVLGGRAGEKNGGLRNTIILFETEKKKAPGNVSDREAKKGPKYLLLLLLAGADGVMVAFVSAGYIENRGKSVDTAFPTVFKTKFARFLSSELDGCLFMCRPNCGPNAQ